MSETHNTVIVGNKMFRYRKEQNLATDPPLDRHELSVNELSRQLAEANKTIKNLNNLERQRWELASKTLGIKGEWR